MRKVNNVREMLKTLKEGKTVFLAPGTYHLTEAVALNTRG